MKHQKAKTIYFPSGVIHAPNSYGDFLDDCEERHARREVQKYCGTCGKWRWPDECSHEGKLTEKELKAMDRMIAKEVRRKYPSGESRYRKELRAARKNGDIVS